MVNFYNGFIACGAQATVSDVAGVFSTFTKEYFKYMPTNYHQKCSKSLIIF